MSTSKSHLSVLEEETTEQKFVPANYIAIFGTCIFGGLGVPGNALLIYLILPNFTKREPYEWIIFNLTLIDFLACLNGVILQAPFSIVDNKVVCQIAGFINSFCLLNALVSVINIPLNRYVSLYHQSNYNTIFNGRKIFIVCSFQWLLCLVPGILIILNQSLGMDNLTGLCSTIIKSKLETVCLVGYVCLTVLTYAAAIYCTCKVVQKLRQHKLLLQISNIQTQVLKESGQLVIIVVLLLFIPTFTQMPNLIIRLIQMICPVSHWVSRTLIAPNLFTSACNPYLTIFIIKQYRCAAKRLFRIGINQVQPITQSFASQPLHIRVVRRQVLL